MNTENDDAISLQFFIQLINKYIQDYKYNNNNISLYIYYID